MGVGIVKWGEGGREERVWDVHSTSSASLGLMYLRTAEPERKEWPCPPGRGVGVVVREKASRTDGGGGAGAIFGCMGGVDGFFRNCKHKAALAFSSADVVVWWVRHSARAKRSEALGN